MRVLLIIALLLLTLLAGCSSSKSPTGDAQPIAVMNQSLANDTTGNKLTSSDDPARTPKPNPVKLEDVLAQVDVPKEIMKDLIEVLAQVNAGYFISEIVDKAPLDTRRGSTVLHELISNGILPIKVIR